MATYYDWETTLSYDADVTMVVSSRGLGKTYGLRKQFIRDYLKCGYRFVEVCRYKSEVSDVAAGYFDRVGEEYPDYVFRTDSRKAYIAPKPPSEDQKPQWEVIGYFVALTEMQKNKKRTFQNVRRLVMDEAVLDHRDRFHSYLPNEFSLLANTVDSCSRERADGDNKPPRVYLLGNACDLMNPYFVRYRVDKVPEYGRRWYGGKTFLLDYVKPGEYEQEKREGTVAGRMLRGTDEERVASGNQFSNNNDEFIEEKTKWCRFYFGMVFNRRKYGVWYDDVQGLYYVNGKIPRNTDRPIYTLTREDDSINYQVALKSNPMLKTFAGMYEYGVIRFETVGIKAGFMDALAMLGIR